MRGDFSAWNKDRAHNFRGTLHQQGRVLLDRDWNAQTEVFNEWQETAGRDAFGAGVAAIPAEVPDSFKVTKAEIAGIPAHVEVTVNKGRVWADGLLAELGADEPSPPTDVVRTATYLGPPIQATPLPNDLPSNSDRDAVILETWLEELSPFQVPNLLIEPALGGVDTTERVHTAFRFRLFRMDVGDTCDSIIDSLKDKFADKGKLTANLNPTTDTGGDCPVIESGGYTGFEHQLYRIEIANIARPAAEGAYFKWSQFNGGLVGRGVFDGVNKKVDIGANQNAIAHCGVSNFYLEAIDFDADTGCWEVIYGASVTLNADNTLTLPATAANVFFGMVPAKTDVAGNEIQHFFRLWNGIEQVTPYFITEKELPDNVGIKLKFNSGDADKYTPSDFWTFEVRVGQGVDAATAPLVDNRPPQGIFYHRVPLAEVTWAANPADIAIEDCRQIFQPLTKLKTCCTYRVGDGIKSHGDFKKIQDAIDALPKDGGEVCILPGKYEENVILFRRFNRDAIIILRGCGDRTQISVEDVKLPVITIGGVSNVSVESMYLINPVGGGILLLGDDRGGDDAATLKGDDIENALIEQIIKKKKEADPAGRGSMGRLTNISLDRLRIDSGFKSGIRMYTGYFVSITNCRVFMDDVNTENPGVFLSGDDIDFERNRVQVQTLKRLAGELRPESLKNFNPNAFGLSEAAQFAVAEKATGGLQLAGGCERIRVIDNLIIGGNGNGITLGSVDVIEANGVKRIYSSWHVGAYHDKGDCNPNPGNIPDPGTPGGSGVRYEIGPSLYDILIERNRIFSMGRNGIGVEAFAAIGQKSGAVGRGNTGLNAGTSSALAGLGRLQAVMVERLTIIGNRIERCVSRSLPEVSQGLSLLMGRGGIALSIVDGLVIRDNDILDNGASYIEPVCGIFVLVGIGVEISRNRILGNGANPVSTQSNSEPKKGARGGILIFMGADGISRNAGASGLRQTSPSGESALKLHENIVSAPLGRALTMFYRGHVSIADNQLLSLKAEPLSVILPTAVLILGIDGLKNIGALMAAAFGNQPGSTQKVRTMDFRIFRDQFMNGALEFANNQVEAVHRDTVAKDGFLALSSIMILTGDDLSFLGNQCFARHPGRLMWANAMLAGGTLRAIANSWMEYPATAHFSAVTLGMMNTTTDNHSTHCLLVRGSLFIDSQNLTMVDAAAAYDASGNPVRSIDGDNAIPDPESLCNRLNALIPPIVYPIEK